MFGSKVSFFRISRYRKCVDMFVNANNSLYLYMFVNAYNAL